jgi:hypothetical protein
MCLLYHMSLGDEGPFAPYLRSLPYPVTLRDWSPGELAEVDPYVWLCMLLDNCIVVHGCTGCRPHRIMQICSESAAGRRKGDQGSV